MPSNYNQPKPMPANENVFIGFRTAPSPQQSPSSPMSGHVENLRTKPIHALPTSAPMPPSITPADYTPRREQSYGQSIQVDLDAPRHGMGETLDVQRISFQAPEGYSNAETIYMEKFGQ